MKQWLTSNLNEPLPPTTFEQWKETGKTITSVGNRAMWKIAAWLCAGEERFPHEYVQIAEELHLSENTLYQAAGIFRAVRGLNLPEGIPFWICQPLATDKLLPEDRQLLLDRWEGKSAKEFRALVSEYRRILNEAKEDQTKLVISRIDDDQTTQDDEETDTSYNEQDPMYLLLNRHEKAQILLPKLYRLLINDGLKPKDFTDTVAIIITQYAKLLGGKLE